MSDSNGGGALRPDTSDMLAVHQVFREALRAAPRLVGDVPAGDTARSELVGSYYDNVLRFLEVHHEGEDLLVTPLLAERCTDDEAEVVLRVATQHKEVLGPLEDADEALGSWRFGAEPGETSDAAAALVALGQVLTPHLDEEEQAVLPLAAAHLTLEEWGALPGHGMQSFTGDNLWLILGLIRESMTADQRGQMLAHMPPPVADAWRTTGEAEFRAFIGQVRSAL